MTVKIENPQVPVVESADDPIVLGLKRLYDSVLEEAVPSDFMDLLSQIDASLAPKKNDTAPKDPVSIEDSILGQSS